LSAGGAIVGFTLDSGAFKHGPLFLFAGLEQSNFGAGFGSAA
jgi:hypothetical protein